jgi:arsenate reductase
VPSFSEQTVLFVCVENTFRSIISEAIFNAYAPKGWRAESAGVRPAATINPIAIDLLQEIGIEIGLKMPRLVTPEMIARATRVVTFGCLDRCPIGAKEKSADWPIPGSTTGNGDLRNREELQAIRGELERRILRLIHEIDRNTQPK